jgi:hypothetical protein
MRIQELEEALAKSREEVSLVAERLEGDLKTERQVNNEC